MKNLSRSFMSVSALIFAYATTTAAAPVKAPPLPRGSEKVKLHPGLNPSEMARDKNAHKRPQKKDKTLDDTRPSAAKPNAPQVK